MPPPPPPPTGYAPPPPPPPAPPFAATGPPYATGHPYLLPPGYPPPPPLGGRYPGYAPPPTDRRAVGALVCGSVGLLTAVPCSGITGLVMGIAGFALGISSLHRIDEARGALRGRGLAVAAMIVGALAAVAGFIVLVLSVILVAYTLTHPTRGTA
jgi:hypothetical protein